MPGKAHKSGQISAQGQRLIIQRNQWLEVADGGVRLCFVRDRPYTARTSKIPSQDKHLRPPARLDVSAQIHHNPGHVCGWD